MDSDCETQVKIARLEEQVKASATALRLAEALTAAQTVAARAQVHSNWSSMIAVLSLLGTIAMGLWVATHGGH